jgi:hypothetical protein
MPPVKPVRARWREQWALPKLTVAAPCNLAQLSLVETEICAKFEQYQQ